MPPNQVHDIRVIKYANLKGVNILEMYARINVYADMIVEYIVCTFYPILRLTILWYMLTYCQLHAIEKSSRDGKLHKALDGVQTLHLAFHQ